MVLFNLIFLFFIFNIFNIFNFIRFIYIYKFIYNYTFNLIIKKIYFIEEMKRKYKNIKIIKNNNNFNKYT
jgi:hypothetical protein